MATHAYSELYLDTSPRILGDAVCYAVDSMNLSADRFMGLFIVSGYAELFEKGAPQIVAGINGCELVKKSMEKCGLDVPDMEDVLTLDKTPEYWSGWALAQYQWESAKSFKSIHAKVPMSEIIRMYRPVHEADISKFFDVMDDKMKTEEKVTRLRTYRDAIGMSQSELAKAADISVRQIQLFEQKQRDINKTQAITLAKLARALGTKSEMLLEN